MDTSEWRSVVSKYPDRQKKSVYVYIQMQNPIFWISKARLLFSFPAITFNKQYHTLPNIFLNPNIAFPTPSVMSNIKVSPWRSKLRSSNAHYKVGYLTKSPLR